LQSKAAVPASGVSHLDIWHAQHLLIPHRTYFKQALAVFEDRNAYKGECARILHLLGVMSESKGEDDGKIEVYESRALALYKEVVESGKLAVFGATLQNLDYNKVVAFWAR